MKASRQQVNEGQINVPLRRSARLAEKRAKENTLREKMSNSPSILRKPTLPKSRTTTAASVVGNIVQVPGGPRRSQRLLEKKMRKAINEVVTHPTTPSPPKVKKASGNKKFAKPKPPKATPKVRASQKTIKEATKASSASTPPQKDTIKKVMVEPSKQSASDHGKENPVAIIIPGNSRAIASVPLQVPNLNEKAVQAPRTVFSVSSVPAELRGPNWRGEYGDAYKYTPARVVKFDGIKIKEY